MVSFVAGLKPSYSKISYRRTALFGAKNHTDTEESPGAVFLIVRFYE